MQLVLKDGVVYDPQALLKSVEGKIGFTAPRSAEKDPRLTFGTVTSLQQPLARVFAEHAVRSLPTTQASSHIG